MREAENISPRGTITATLSNNNSSIQLSNSGQAHGKGKVYLILDNSVPEGIEWTKVTVKSRVELKDVIIKWKNSTM